MYICKKCNKSYDNYLAYGGHVGMCEKRKLTTCPICTQQIAVQTLKEHLEKHKKHKPCLFCGKLTFNEKFCGRSCSAKYTNTQKVNKKTGNIAIKYCKNCGNVLVNNRYTFCQSCIKQRKHVHTTKLLEDCKTDRSRKKFISRKKNLRCYICGNTEWMGKLIPLELEHKDGNPLNNTENNLELICPNCHAQTSTYKGKNKGNGRFIRRQRYSANQSY